MHPPSKEFSINMQICFRALKHLDVQKKMDLRKNFEMVNRQQHRQQKQQNIEKKNNCRIEYAFAKYFFPKLVLLIKIFKPVDV